MVLPLANRPPTVPEAHGASVHGVRARAGQVSHNVPLVPGTDLLSSFASMLDSVAVISVLLKIISTVLRSFQFS